VSVTRVIRYITRPECADENARLISAVFAGLDALKPEGLEYKSLRLEDGLTFVHVVTMSGEGNPLLGLEAFQAFSSTVADRCTEGPLVMGATTLGDYIGGELPGAVATPAASPRT
jgi:hypothetical protein